MITDGLTDGRTLAKIGIKLAPPLLRSAGASAAQQQSDIYCFDLVISLDYILTDEHDISKVLNIKGNFT